MRYVIRSDEPPEFSLCETDEAKSAVQNVRLLLQTRRGTVPMLRDYGLPMEFNHLPTEAMQTRAAEEVIEALAAFEPRAAYVDLSFEFAEGDPSHNVMILEVDIP